MDKVKKNVEHGMMTVGCPRKVSRSKHCSGAAFVPVNAGLYAFVKAPCGAGATKFVARAIESNVLIIPGNVFSEKDTHFRISYATSDEKIRQGVEILRSLALQTE